MEDTNGPIDPFRPLAGEAATWLRVYTLGSFHIEWVDPQTGQVQPLPAERLHKRGAAPALALFKALLCRPDRFATRDWLLEQFWPESSARSASDRLDDVASALRGLLRPDGCQDKILHFVYGADGRGNGYRLEDYPSVWCDADALAWHIEQAARMQRYGDDPLPFWQRAYDLASRGTYLPEQCYDDWSKARREETHGHLRQAVHALSRLYLERFGQAGEEEALLVLRTYWQQYQTDEDALRQLMELLGKRERFQEALEYYEKVTEALAEEGIELDARTRDLAEYIRTKQLQRPYQGIEAKPSSFAREEHPFRHSSRSESAQFRIPLVRADLPLEHRIPIAAPSALAHMLSFEIAPENDATRIGIRLAYILTFIQQWSKQTLCYDILQAIIHREISMFDETQETSSIEDWILSRRQALITLASLPTMFASLISERSFFSLPEEFLPQCAASLTACWHLLRGQEFLLVEKILSRYLPVLADVSHQLPMHHTTAAGLATQGYRLMGIIALHRNNPRARTAYFKSALHFAEISETPNLLASALISLALSRPEYLRASF